MVAWQEQLHHGARRQTNQNCYYQIHTFTYSDPDSGQGSHAPGNQLMDIRAKLIATAGQQKADDTAEYRGEGQALPGLLVDITIGRFTGILNRFGCLLFPIPKFVCHFSCFHRANINRAE